MSLSYITRYSLGERIIHWLATFGFIYLLISGLALRSPSFYGLALFCGGAATAARLHPWMGVVYFGAVLWLFAAWAVAMRLDSTDRVWLRHVRRYLHGQALELPTTGKFHGGQKALFWAQVGGALVLFLSGIILWFPESFPGALRSVGLFLHELGFILVSAVMILHVYISLFLARGALRGMLYGTVTDRWAKTHHPRWFRDHRRP